jgi:hypothetical protein
MITVRRYPYLIFYTAENDEVLILSVRAMQRGGLWTNEFRLFEYCLLKCPRVAEIASSRWGPRCALLAMTASARNFERITWVRCAQSFHRATTRPP